MFEIALKAKIPVISVTTDDVLNVGAILQSIAKKQVTPLPNQQNAVFNDNRLYFTEDVEAATVTVYKKLADSGAQLIVVNPKTPSTLVFDGGELPVPDAFLAGYLDNFVDAERVPDLLTALKGLSLKAASEVVQLAMVRTGAITPEAVRSTRLMLGGAVPGLSTLDTSFDFYLMPPALENYVKENDAYFLPDGVPRQLRPRGVLMEGIPGVGKSMGARVLAHHWKVPCFRLDIATSLNRYLGESESRFTRGLGIVERNAPCVLLLDEIEKLFGGDAEEGTTTRLLSILLWWLQEHREKIITVMTTNKLKAIPRELYRPGRIDEVIRVKGLTPAEAKVFAHRVFESLMGTKLTFEQQKAIGQVTAPAKTLVSHASIASKVYALIKQKGWLAPEIDTDALQKLDLPA